MNKTCPKPEMPGFLAENSGSQEMLMSFPKQVGPDISTLAVPEPFEPGRLVISPYRSRFLMKPLGTVLSNEQLAFSHKVTRADGVTHTHTRTVWTSEKKSALSSMVKAMTPFLMKPRWVVCL